MSLTYNDSVICTNVSNYMTCNKNNLLKVYPNPFSDATNFIISDLEIGGHLIEIYATTGVLIKKDHFANNKYIFYKQHLKPGFYYYRITNIKGDISSGKPIITD